LLYLEEKTEEHSILRLALCLSLCVDKQ
jgi:hypothetical protein